MNERIYTGRFGRAADFSDMRLESLPDSIIGQKDLTELNLSDNWLADLPSELSQFDALKRLVLSGNRFRSIPNVIFSLLSLEELSLATNELDTLPSGIAQLKNLKILNLSNNFFSKLPPDIGKLTDLTLLDLSANCLVQLPIEMRKLADLRIFKIVGNTQLPLPQDIFPQPSNRSYVVRSPSPQAVIDYCLLHQQWSDVITELPAELVDETGLSSLSEEKQSLALDYLEVQRKRSAVHGSRPLNEAKVIVLGEAEVGKSSIVLALTQNRLGEHLSQTHGIERNVWRVPLRSGKLASHDDGGDEILRLNMWDFGGQDIYSSTHTFFLTHRAVYLLVVDIRRSDEQNKIDFWLKMVESYGNKSPVWIAVNKCDENNENLNEDLWHKNFPLIFRGAVHTSCVTGEGLETLGRSLATEALSIDGVTRPMNNVWFNIKSSLEIMDRETLSLDE